MGFNDKLVIHADIDWSPLNATELDLRIRLLEESGAGIIREGFTLSKFTSNGTTWNFSVHDNVVNKLAEKGIAYLAIISQFDYYCPVYARRAGYDTGNRLLSTEAYAQFCTKIAEHFGDRVFQYEFGNEPNGNTFWGNQPPNAANYTNWYVKPGYEAIKAVNPDLTTWAGSLSQVSWGGGDGLGEMDVYLQKMYAAGVKDYCDGISVHPYNRPHAPNFNVLDRCRVIMDLNGDEAKPITISELGWPSGTDFNAVSEANQALFLTQAFQKIMPGGTHDEIPFLIWHNFKDDGLNLASSEGNYGIVHNQNFPYPHARKPAFYAFQTLAKNLNSPLPSFRRST